MHVLDRLHVQLARSGVSQWHESRNHRRGSVAIVPNECHDEPQLTVFSPRRYFDIPIMQTATTAPAVMIGSRRNISLAGGNLHAPLVAAVPGL